ncbi:uncharacterized protein LOC144752260 isoform X2 [Lissotriton helveticus]
MCLKKYLRDQTRHEDNWQELLACCCFPYVRAIMTRVELVRPPAFYLEELKTLVEEVLPHYDLLYGSPDDRALQNRGHHVKKNLSPPAAPAQLRTLRPPVGMTLSSRAMGTNLTPPVWVSMWHHYDQQLQQPIM